MKLLKAHSNDNFIKFNHQFYLKVVNKTDIVFTDVELNMMYKELNFNLN